MSYYGYKSYENELIKEILEKSNKTPIELIKSYSPVPEEEIGSISSISTCEMFFSEEAFTYKIFWGLIVYYLEKEPNLEIDSKWLKTSLLLYNHLEKEIVEDEFLNKNWFSQQKRKNELEYEKNNIINRIKINNHQKKLLSLNIKVI